VGDVDSLDLDLELELDMNSTQQSSKGPAAETREAAVVAAGDVGTEAAQVQSRSAEQERMRKVEYHTFEHFIPVLSLSEVSAGKKCVCSNPRFMCVCVCAYVEKHVHMYTCIVFARWTHIYIYVHVLSSHVG